MKLPEKIQGRREHYKKRFEAGKMSETEYEVTLSKIDKREVLLIKRANDKIKEREERKRREIRNKKRSEESDIMLAILEAQVKELKKDSNQERDSKRRLLAIELRRGTIQVIYEDNIKKYGTLTCYLCLQPVKFGKDHLEHKIPISRGGTNDYDNLAISCQACNSGKHSKTLEEYREWKKA